MPDVGPATRPPAATTDDLDAQCRGIGTSAVSSTRSTRAAQRSVAATGAGVSAEVPVARPAVRYGDGPAASQASRRP
jgi:hypothetical protein